MSRAGYTIWHDADYDLAHWFLRNSTIDADEATIRAMPRNTSVRTLEKAISEDADTAILPLLKYEHPDIAITAMDGSGSPRALCAIEFMTHTPQWQHPAQRFSRIYGAAALGIPSALVAPGVKTKLEKKEGEYKDVQYKLSGSVRYLFKRTEEISGTPARLFEWPDRGGYPVLDRKSPAAPRAESGIRDMFRLVDSCVTGAPAPAPDHPDVAAPETKDFGTICSVGDTKECLDGLGISAADVPCELLGESLVFCPDGLSPKSSYFRTDPYAGMLCAFDNMFCRDDSGQRSRSIIFVAGDVSLAELRRRGTFEGGQTHDATPCPFEEALASSSSAISHARSGCPFTGSKQQKIYGTVPDMVVFDDTRYSRGEEF